MLPFLVPQEMEAGFVGPFISHAVPATPSFRPATRPHEVAAGHVIQAAEYSRHFHADMRTLVAYLLSRRSSFPYRRASPLN